MKIAVLLYEKMTALDAIGPYEVLSRLPEAEVVFAAEKAGPVTTDTGFLQLQAERSIYDVKDADILLVPGGPGDEAIRNNAIVLAWVRGIHARSQYTTSVCTGSLILAAAGILEGIDATTHWTRLEVLRQLGAVPVSERVVERGKIFTAAGVSAGIDMGLTLLGRIAGDDFAQAIQLGIEYDPAPPFVGGSPDKAPEAIVELVRAGMA